MTERICTTKSTIILSSTLHAIINHKKKKKKTKKKEIKKLKIWKKDVDTQAEFKYNYKLCVGKLSMFVWFDLIVIQDDVQVFQTLHI